MKIIQYFKNLFISKKKIDLKNLPSQGYFYNDEFAIHIKKAEELDITEYESEFTGDLGLVLNKIKSVVKKNTIIPNNYKFSYIKSIDIIFIFFEIVKFTKNKKIVLNYFDEYGEEINVEFSSSTFNYFDFGEVISYWNKSECCFDISGYKYTLPSIGVENSLTNFLIDKSYSPDAEKYNTYNYVFVYFVGNKEYLSLSEVDNLIEIFNFDIDQDEMDKVNKILNMFALLQRYSLIKDGKVIEISSKINLETIWK